MASKWRENVWTTGFGGLGYDLAARVLEGAYTGYYLTNLKTNPGFYIFQSSIGIELAFLQVFDPRPAPPNFPYFFKVEPDH